MYLVDGVVHEGPVYELTHKPVPGEDFMPYGWCGSCETCNMMPCPDVCERCSYTDTFDLRSPANWPCLYEKQRVDHDRRQRMIEENWARQRERENVDMDV
jgi:hypothetical protein